MTLLLRGLDEHTEIVPTAAFETIRDRLDYAIALRGVMAVSGPHGCGKRVALMSTLAALDVPHVAVRLKQGSSAPEVVQQLYAAVHKDRDVYDRRRMEDDLVHTFTGRTGVLVVDDAHHLTTPGAAELHWLHEHPGINWCFVLLGGPGTCKAATADAGLRGDVISAVALHKLEGAALWSVVRGMHPVFRFADADLLDAFNRRYCGGLIKPWARTLELVLKVRRTATERGLEPPTFDSRLANAIGKEHPQLPTDRPFRNR